MTVSRASRTLVQMGRIAIGLDEDVAAAPTAVGGAKMTAQTVVDEAEEGGCVAFHDVLPGRVKGTEGAVGADVGFEPFIGDEFPAVAGGVAVEADHRRCRSRWRDSLFVGDGGGGDGVGELGEVVRRGSICRRRPDQRWCRRGSWR